MAYCRKCGSELADGVKFCTNCGTAVEISSEVNNTTGANDYVGSSNNEKYNTYNGVQKNKGRKSDKQEQTALEKFSKFFGIILMLISFVVFNSDPPILTVVLSIIIIAAALFCLSQKYKLKLFTVIALIIAVICLFAAISQGKEMGFLNIPKDEEYAEAYGKTDEEALEESTDIDDEKKDQDDASDLASSTAKKADNAKEEDSAKVHETGASAQSEKDEEASTDTVETIDGVDPELKAFLDSYEEFMDEYVDFMKKYSEDPGNALTLIGEYASIMERYAEFSEKADKYDEKEMSTEDAKYYLEVTNRINQKILEVY